VKGDGRRVTGEGRREKGEGRREKGEGRREGRGGSFRRVVTLGRNLKNFLKFQKNIIHVREKEKESSNPRRSKGI
jgi:hypothetical protein